MNLAETGALRNFSTVVLFDRSDVAALPDDQRQADGAALVALSPSARTAAMQVGLQGRLSTTTFSHRDHARCVALAGKAIRELAQAPAARLLPQSVLLMAKQAVWGHANLACRLHRSLPHGPWIARDMAGDWVEAADWVGLQRIMLPRIWHYGLAHKVESRRPHFPWLLRLLARNGARKAGRRSTAWFAAPSRKLKNNFSQALTSAGAAIAVLQPTLGGWKDYADVMRALRTPSSVQTFPIAPLPADDRQLRQTLALLDAMGASLSNPRVKHAWTLYQPFFAQTLPAMLAMCREGARLLHFIRPRAALSYEVNSWNSAALLDASAEVGVEQVIFNHNSQPRSTSTIANSVLDTLFRQRTWNPLVKRALMWSPAALQWPTVTADAAAKAVPVRLSYPESASSRPAGKLRVLHAGNYQNWSDFFPWIAETADEYLNGLETLAGVVEQLEGVELTMRVRPKREVDAASVEQRLGRRRNVSICGVDEDFLEQLAEHDLLIAHFSTTVEQALQMDKLVLLWGSAHRYEQFPAQATPPAGHLADSVYVAHDAQGLALMLSALRDAQDSPERLRACRQQYRFDTQTASLDTLAKALAAPVTSLPQ